MDCNPVAIRTSQPLQRFLKVTSTFVPRLRRSASRGKARTEIYYVVIRGFMAPSIYNNPAEALKEPCSFRWAYIEQYPTWNTAAFAWRSVLFGHIVSPIGIPDYLLALLLIFAEGAESSDEQDSPWWHHATHASWPQALDSLLKAINAWNRAVTTGMVESRAGRAPDYPSSLELVRCMECGDGGEI